MLRFKPLTNSPVRPLALCLFVLALTEIVFLSTFVPLDEAFARWVGAGRSCTLDQVGTQLKNWPIIALLVLGVLFLAGLCLRRGWAEAQHAMTVVVLGGFLSELLKIGCERARPSVLPPLIVGNSFPSGHVTGAVLIAGTLGFLLVRQRWAVWAKLGGACVLIGLVSVITWQRLYLAHHWLSDIIGSFLLAGAWLCFALPRPALLHVSRRFALVCVGLLVCYQLFSFFPVTRLALPSAVATTGEPLLTLSFGEPETQTLLHGAWGEQDREPAGPITWAGHGEASVDVQFPGSQAYTLKLAMRPWVQAKRFACFPLEILVNQHLVGRLLLYRGWREYALSINPTLFVPGTNVITFRVGAEFPDSTPRQRTVAFRYLRLFAAER